MKHPKLTIWRIICRKLAVMILLIVSAAGAYATLGDGKSKSGIPNSSLLSNKSSLRPGSFSLKSGYTYRGNEVINNNGVKRYIQMNTVVTLQKGNISYIVPLKKKVVLGNIRIDISNRQLHRN